MRSPRRSRSRSRPRSFALGLAAVALAATSCGVAAGETTGPVEPSFAGLPSIGELPEAVIGRPAAEARSCTVDPDDAGQALVEAVVVNTTSGPKLMQGLPLTVRDGTGTVVSSDSEDLWSSIRIGAGRRLLMQKSVDLDDEVDEVSCEVGQPDLRDDALPGGDEIDPVDLRLTSCSPTIGVTVENTSDRPVSVAVVVEAFDAAGFSAGTFELGQRPTTYSNGTAPGPDEVALSAGETGTYSVDPSERISDYGTPMEGPVTSCQVLAARQVEDPTVVEVIVD